MKRYFAKEELQIAGFHPRFVSDGTGISRGQKFWKRVF